jgi:DNA (cytosine-5)-methyltransferase 3A
MKIKVLSLFDGISVAQQALKELGYDVEYYASEIDKYAIQITQKNHPGTKQLGDIKTISDDAKDDYISICLGGKQIDLLIGGSPCQDLSIAKKNRQGLDGARSGLFWEYVRILKEVKPKYFVLENVASMPSEARDAITKTLGVEPIIINAALVSAQKRKRYFWTNIPNITLPEDKEIKLKHIIHENTDGKDIKKYIVLTKDGIEKLKSNTVRTSGRGSGFDDKHNWDTIRIGQIGKGGQGDRIYSLDGKSVALSANGGGRGAKTGLYFIDDTLVVREATKKGYAVIEDGQAVDMSFPNSKTRRGRVGDKVKNLMTSQNIAVVVKDYVRKLTPIECERLQSLPDNYTEGISNSQRYKCLGNAFNKEVVKHILRNICSS